MVVAPASVALLTTRDLRCRGQYDVSTLRSWGLSTPCAMNQKGIVADQEAVELGQVDVRGRKTAN